MGCDAAVQQVRRSGIRLTTPEERTEIRAVVEERTRALLDEDLAVLGYYDWLENLERGVAAHHAGMLPAFKEVVEELFRRKLVKAVFATETLALGINMPARTVVLEKLEKFNGEARVAITSGEYTQITGRAGRRGIDVEGHAVIQWTEGLDPQAVAALASRRTYPLNSSFRPTYNMAVNLIDQFGRPKAREILESSFAQFQADRAVVGLARQVREQEASLEGYRSAMTCDRGDFTDYAAIRRDLSDLEKLLRKDANASRGTREKRQSEIASLRRRMQRHACHQCPDREQHARWAERYWRLHRTVEGLRRQIESRTGTVARIFDRVVDVLDELEYVAAGRTTGARRSPRPDARCAASTASAICWWRSRCGRDCGTDWMPRPSPPSPAASCTNPAVTTPVRRSADFRVVRSAPPSARRRSSGSTSTTSSARTASRAPSRSPRVWPARCTRGRAGCRWTAC